LPHENNYLQSVVSKIKVMEFVIAGGTVLIAIGVVYTALKRVFKDS
jgi:hypothetical protein